METIAQDFKKGIELCGYKPTSEIGRGAYGTIYMVIDENGEMHALKIIEASKKYHKGNLDSLGVIPINEVDTLSRFIHPYIMRANAIITHRTCEIIDNIGLLLPLMPFTSMGYLNNPLVTLMEKLLFAKKVAIGIEFLHRQGVLHLDIKSTNILAIPSKENTINQGPCQTGPTVIPIIADFGFSTHVSDVKTGIWIEKELVTISHRAPEHLDSFSFKTSDHVYRWSGSTDVWSFGILLIEFFSGGIPFPYDFDFEKNDVKVYLGQLRTPEDKNSFLYKFLSPYIAPIEPRLKSLISSILDWDPAKRPTMTQILESNIMKTVPDIKVSGLTVTDTPKLIDGELPGLNHEGIISAVTLISSIFRNMIKTIRISVLFQAIDTFYRAAALMDFVDDTSGTALIILSAVCIWVSAKSLFHRLSVGELLDMINSFRPDLQIKTEEIIDMEERLIGMFSGVLYRRFIYDHAINSFQLKYAYDHIFYNPEVYYEYNPSEIALVSPREPSSKELLIEQFFN